MYFIYLNELINLKPTPMTEQQKLQNAKDAVAKEYGYNNWKHCNENVSFQASTANIIDKVAIKYQQLCEADKWISVDERLPEINDEYLLRCYQAEGFDQYYHRVGYWDDDRFNLDEAHVADDSDNPIRFWKPFSK